MPLLPRHIGEIEIIDACQSDRTRMARSEVSKTSKYEIREITEYASSGAVARHGPRAGAAERYHKQSIDYGVKPEIELEIGAAEDTWIGGQTLQLLK